VFDVNREVLVTFDELANRYVENFQSQKCFSRLKSPSTIGWRMYSGKCAGAISLKAVQELLGHADIKMTMRYSHLSQSHLQDAMAVLNKIGNGHQMDTKTPKRKEADNLSIATPL
jgi:integrase